MAIQTDKELFDAVTGGDDLTPEDGMTVETEFQVDPEAEPVDEPDPETETTEEAEPEQETATDEEAEVVEPELEAVEAETTAEGVKIPKQQYDRIRAKQKEAEAQATERAQENAALQVRLDQLERLMTAQAQPKPPEADPEDAPYIDPDTRTVLSQVVSELEQKRVNDRVEMSLMMAEQAFGDEFAEAAAFLDQHGTPQLAQQIRQQRNPGAAIVQYYRNQKTLSEVGTDPAAYRDKLRAEIEAEIAADPARAEAIVSQVRAQATTRKPDGSPAIKTAPSLSKGSRAADARPHTEDPIAGLSDEAIFAQVTRTS